MKICPIVRKEIDDKECEITVSESYSECKDKKAAVPNKFKRIVGWRAICQQCKHHNKK